MRTVFGKTRFQQLDAHWITWRVLKYSDAWIPRHSDFLGTGDSLDIWIFISSTALEIFGRSKFLVRSREILTNQKLSWRAKKNRWNQMNRRPLNVCWRCPIFAQPPLSFLRRASLSTHRPTTYRHVAGYLLTAKSCFLQRPHMYSPAL